MGASSLVWGLLLHMNVGGLAQQKSVAEAKCLDRVKRSSGKSTRGVGDSWGFQ